jgi:two-component system nitrate/nitrite response regulator NarL
MGPNLGRRLNLSPIRVVLTSEVRLHREGLVSKLAADGGIELVASADALGQSARLLEEHAADIVLLDMAASPDNLAGVSDAVARLPDARFVVLGVVEVDEAMSWAEAGVAGFLEPWDSLEELRAVLESVLRDELRCSPRIAAALLRRVRATARERSPRDTLARLTVRELEIVGLIGEGLSNKEIAERTALRMPTVKNHVRQILQKLEVSTRSAAATLAVGVRGADGAGPGSDPPSG